MNQQDYLDALRAHLAGLSPDLVAKTMTYYEQTFNEGLAAGRSSAEIAADLGDPKKIALTLRSNTHRQAFVQQKTPLNLLRVLVSLAGLAVFNLFMVIPAAVYAAMLLTFYGISLSFYLGGIAITASGLSGANELLIDGPMRYLMIQDDEGNRLGEHGPTSISIGDAGIEIHSVPPRAEAGEPAESPTRHGSSRLLEKAEQLAGSSLLISTDMDSDARITQSVIGMAMVIGGIILFLLNLVVTRLTLIGLRRYLAMNVAILKGQP